MSDRSRETAFSKFVLDHRGRLLGAAYLVHGRREHAEDAVESALAQLYASWPSDSSAALPRVLQQVLRAGPGQVVLPWRRRGRFELVDNAAGSTAPQPGLVADLANLDEDTRRVLVLQSYLGLSVSETAEVLSIDPARVETLSHQARGRLTAWRSDLGSADAVGAQLELAAGESALAQVDADVDAAHGRLLVLRRRLRTAAAAVAVLVVGVLGVGQLASARMDDGHRLSGLGVSTPPAAEPPCDLRLETCRGELARQWRTEMAEVASSYVDPEGSYFAGYTSSSDDLYDSPGFWQGQGGLLGLDLFRLTDGATEVYVQIASSAEFALPCGMTTGQSCRPVRFTDGNVFTLTDTTYAAEGLEAQYSPSGTEVITVVARNTAHGRALGITRADLITLVQDPRLRLPHY